MLSHLPTGGLKVEDEEVSERLAAGGGLLGRAQPLLANEAWNVPDPVVRFTNEAAFKEELTHQFEEG
jgi:hypothetical protein